VDSSTLAASLWGAALTRRRLVPFGSRSSICGRPNLDPGGRVAALLPTAKDFETAPLLDVAPGMHATGEQFRGFGAALIMGAPNLYTPGTDSTTCRDWSSSQEVTTGFSPFSTFPAQLQMGCGPWQILCFEE
jgi:hypothetical protein